MPTLLPAERSFLRTRRTHSSVTRVSTSAVKPHTSDRRVSRETGWPAPFSRQRSRANSFMVSSSGVFATRASCAASESVMSPKASSLGAAAGARPMSTRRSSAFTRITSMAGEKGFAR
jgi:hypothetical protein